MFTAMNVIGKDRSQARAVSESLVARPEESYSAFYKRQLYLAVLDDFAAFSGGVHKYADDIIRQLIRAESHGLITGLERSWFESPDDASHPFHGRNLRNFLAGKDSSFAIWAVLDLYVKAKHPIIARGFRLDGYLERLGHTLSEFIGSHALDRAAAIPDALYRFDGLPDLPDGFLAFLSVQPLTQRRFGICHMIIRAGEANLGGGLTDRRCAVRPGVVIPGKSSQAFCLLDPRTDNPVLGTLRLSGDAPDASIVVEGSICATALLEISNKDEISTLRQVTAFCAGDAP
ncbi:hypothetical protein [Parvularcula sp. LCG005]|uniref:hypothetical protein n=1 Tax=Parvularcula sp. LCG005 TaxID=3078805 RepID=UPI002943453F|nr:hypothetical protein [Parvularcula sp. LCG005]WOI52572.1 hypothetical protein RUI03_10480 [Parvularcula sp. LCG005]